LKSSESHQLTLAFADNSAPKGRESGQASKADVSAGKAYLLYQADANLMNETDARIDSGGELSVENLLEEVASLPNLAAALLRVARNKGAPGVDGLSVQEVVEHAQQLLPKVQRALLQGNFIAGDIRRVWIPKPGGGERGLGIPNVVDRMVQQAVHQVIEPIFEPIFHDGSHGFRRDRGAQTAIASATGCFEEGYAYTVDIDLSKFFDRVHHQRLLGRMSEHVSDGRVLKLIHRMLKANVVLPEGTRVTTEEGTPQGGPLSPLLSNIVLNELDWELDRRGLRFVRYADDFSIFVRSERAGHRVMASVTSFIERKLRLVVNQEKSSVNGPYDLTFLGFELGKDDQSDEVTIGISERTRLRMNVKIRELTPRCWGNSLDRCIDGVNSYLTGWMGYFQLCTDTNSFSRFDAHIRRRLRSIKIRQRKRPRHLFRHLVSRGVSPGMARKAVYGIRGHWKRSASFAVHKAYPNAWFAQRLVNLCVRWTELTQPRALKQLLLFEDV
jgi:group II intron reverse transcriptase/maturase